MFFCNAINSGGSGILQIVKVLLNICFHFMQIEQRCWIILQNVFLYVLNEKKQSTLIYINSSRMLNLLSLSQWCRYYPRAKMRVSIGIGSVNGGFRK
jgi:hypothetical protein